MGIVLFGRTAVPIYRLPGVGRHPVPAFIAPAKPVLRIGIAFSGRAAVPDHRLFQILGDADPVFIPFTQGVPCAHQALLKRLGHERNAARGILPNAAAGQITVAQVHHAVWVAGIGRLRKQFGRLVRVLFYAASPLVTKPQIVEAQHATALRAAPIPVDHLFQIGRHVPANIIAISQARLGPRMPGLSRCTQHLERLLHLAELQQALVQAVHGMAQAALRRILQPWLGLGRTAWNLALQVHHTQIVCGK